MNKVKVLISALIVLLSLALITSESLSQNSCTVWSKLYNGPANLQDSSVAMSQSPLGMIFVTGWSLAAANNADMVTIRYNPDNGDTVWVKRYSGLGAEDKPQAITSDANAVYVTGWTFNGANRNVVTIKYDAVTGNQLWAVTYNGSGNGGDYGYAIKVDLSGNVFVAGRTDVGGAQKYLLLKYDALGNPVAGFPFVYSGAQSTTFDQAQSIALSNPPGSVYITGRSGTSGTENWMTISISAAGTEQWVKKYNGTQNGEDNALVAMTDFGTTSLYIAGYTFTAGQQQNYLVIRYNPATGDSLGAFQYNGPANSTDQLTSATMDNSNNIYITGFSGAVGNGLDYATIKLNSSLSQQWLARTSGSTNEQPTSISVDNASKCVYVTGSIFNGSNYDYLTVGYLSNGAFYWQKTEAGTGNANDFASYVVASDSTRVFVTGSANFSATGIAYYTLRYTACTGIEPISGIVPSSFDLLQNFPNPFNPVTSIRFNIAKSTFTKITVFDITGKEVEVLGSEYLKPGQYEVKWDASKYSSGIYFYSIVTDKFVQTKKMILTK